MLVHLGLPKGEGLFIMSAESIFEWHILTTVAHWPVSHKGTRFLFTYPAITSFFPYTLSWESVSVSSCVSKLVVENKQPIKYNNMTGHEHILQSNNV